MRKAILLYHSHLTVCGVGTWAEMLAGALEGRGWQPTVGLAWGQRFHDPGNVLAVRPQLRSVRMDARTGTEEGRVQAVERAIRDVRPDVVVLSCLHSPLEAVRRLRYAGSRIRFVAVNHGNLPEHAACLMEHREIVDLAVCVSRLSRQVMSQGPAAFAPERIRHIPHGVPSPTVTSPPAEGGRLRVGYAGRLDDTKRAGDLPLFFDALRRRAPAVELWIAGDGSAAPEIRRLADTNAPAVRFFGPLARADLYARFYPHLDLFVHFSPNEGWGLSIAEAMVHRVVPVTSAFLGQTHDALVRDGDTGLVFPVGDTEQAAQRAADLWRDPARRAALGQRAAAEIATRYSVDAFTANWQKALDDCLSLPALPPTGCPVSMHARGRLGLPERYVETVRRVLRRRVPHASAGEEWPHFVCRDQALLAQVRGTFEAEGRRVVV